MQAVGFVMFGAGLGALVGLVWLRLSGLERLIGGLAREDARLSRRIGRLEGRLEDDRLERVLIDEQALSAPGGDDS